MKQLRLKLLSRFTIITCAILVSFSAGVYLQTQHTREKIFKRQIQQLASAAASQMPLILHEIDEYGIQAWEAHKEEILLRFGDEEEKSLKRIRWLNNDFKTLLSYGTFEANPQPTLQKNSPYKIIQLKNGLSILKPFYAEENADNPKQITGYISVELSSATVDQELERLRQGLLTGALLAGLSAILMSQWMINASLKPVREQLDRLTQFTADASHELRHPLTAIRATIGAIKYGKYIHTLDQKLTNNLLKIDQAASRMGKLIDDLLLLARSDRAIPETCQKTSLILEEILEDLVDLHNDELTQRGVEITLGANTENLIKGSPSQIKQLFENLISNAMHYSPVGTKIHITVITNKNHAHVYIDDAGPGVAKANRERVFERFWQADGSRSSSSTGLGLAIVKSIVQNHGGTIVIEASPMGGCRAHVKLPKAQA